MSLTRNFEISTESSKNRSNCPEELEVSEEENECEEHRDSGMSMEGLEKGGPQIFDDLSPEALNYIQRLRSELSDVKEVSYCSVFHFI